VLIKADKLKSQGILHRGATMKWRSWLLLEFLKHSLIVMCVLSDFLFNPHTAENLHDIFIWHCPVLIFCSYLFRQSWR